MFCRSSAHAAAPLAFLTALVLIAPGQRSASAQAATAAADTSAANDPQAQAPPPIAPARSGGFIGEPGFLTSAISFGDRFGEGTGRPKNGFYPEVSNMITGSGWVSIGPGYRQYFADDKMMFETSAA